MFNSLKLALIHNFFFLPLIWPVVSFSLIGDLWVVFDLMVNHLVFSDIFIDGDSDSFFHLVVFSDHLFVGNIFEFAFSLLDLAVFRPDLSALKKHCLLNWLNVRLCSSDYSLDDDWLSLDRWGASASNNLCRSSNNLCRSYNWGGCCQLCWMVAGVNWGSNS